MNPSYKTLSHAGEATITEKRSRFTAHARPVTDEAEAQAFLAELRKKYWDASHHVYAYVLGEYSRASDDGEPQGSGGAPVLASLTSAGVRDAMVVVVRYFGGTLLGVGGLVRAYSQAAKAAIASSGIIEKKLCRSYRAEFDYAVWDRVRRAAEGCIADVGYGEKVIAEFLVEAAAAREFETLVSDASGGIRLTDCGEEYRHTEF